MNDLVIIGEIDVPVFQTDTSLLNDDVFVREISILVSEVSKGSRLEQTAEACLRAFQRYKTLTSPTKPYPSYAALVDPVFLYEYDKIVVLDTLSAKKEVVRIVKDQGGFSPRTILSEIRAIKQLSGPLRRAAWSPVTSDSGNTIRERRHQVARHCEIEKCTSLFYGESGWGSVKPEWLPDERVLLLPGDKARFKGILGADKMKSNESDIDYYRRIRPTAKDIVEKRGLVNILQVDKIGFDDVARGHKYDEDFCKDLRDVMSSIVSKTSEIKDEIRTPEGLSITDSRDSIYISKFFEQRPSSKVDCSRKLKISISKLETAEKQLSRRSVSELPYVRVFDSFQKMQRELVNGVRDPEFDPTPRELIEKGETVEEIRKASPVKISREVAEDVLRGGKLIGVGERVLLVDKSGRRDVYSKAKDPQGELFWALQGAIAVSGVKPCEGEVLFDLCDIEKERKRSLVDSLRDSIEFLTGCDVDTTNYKDSLLYYSPGDKYNNGYLDSIRKIGFRYNVAGANMLLNIDEVILHPEFKEGFTEVSGKDTKTVTEIESTKSTSSMMVSRAVLGMATGSDVDTMGLNTRVLNNMVMFSVSGVSDIEQGDEAERKARALRFITACLQYTIVYITIARQIADKDRRNDKSRNDLFGIAIDRAKSIDFSDLFPERSLLKSAIDKKLVPESIKAIYDDELRRSPLLRDMMSQEPVTVFTLTNGGLSLKNWVGFRPSFQKQDENGPLKDLRSFVRKTMKSAKKSVSGFSKRGRCCEESVPGFSDQLVEETRVDVSLPLTTKSFVSMGVSFPKLNIDMVDDGFLMDISQGIVSTVKKLCRSLRILSSSERGQHSDLTKFKLGVSAASIEYEVVKKALTSIPKENMSLEEVDKWLSSIKLKNGEVATHLVEELVKVFSISAVDNRLLVMRMEEAREQKKNQQVTFVESLDSDAKSAFLAQRDIGIKLDEVMEFELQSSQDAKIEKPDEEKVDDSHEWADVPYETVEDNGDGEV